jgi:hypothetical protein
MTISVALADLAEQVASFGNVGYVVTADQDAMLHVVSVMAAWRDDELVVGAGRHTSQNVEVHPSLTLLWPARPGDPYSLIVDGEGRLVPGEELISIRPARAVLHRVATADQSLPSCVTLLDR